MSFDWTTFVLEVLNFLVLVWILKRFLYRPVLDALDARSARVREETARAEALQRDATLLKQQCEERLAHIGEEGEKARRDLEHELSRMREAGAERVRKALADEEAKQRARYAAAAASREAERLEGARVEAYGNVSAMLARLASPALTGSLAQMLVEDLAALTPEQSDSLRQAASRLGEDKAEDPGLVAGLRVAVGECILHANLVDELALFRERARDA
jgi:F-type H+-transporting ATPase subunit b